MNDRKALLILNMIRGMGGATLKKCMEQNLTPSQLLSADRSKLETIKGLNKKVIKNIISSRSDLSFAEKEIQLIKNHQIHIVTIIDDDYPAYLKEISSPPIILYLKGNRNVLNKRKIGVVGSRKCSSYGVKNTRKLCASLGAYQDICIVSGLAMGIDTAAHQGTLDANGSTIAVLGNGLAHLYPPQNKELADNIINKGGALISEFPLDTSPKKENFPKRNRIISGLSECIVVTEAASRSGALITANMALDQGRCVCSMPGKIDSLTSTGTNELIRDGAKIVTSHADILEEMMINVSRKDAEPYAEDKKIDVLGLSADEQKIIDALDDEPMHVDIICDKTSLPVSKLPALLLPLEIKKVIKSFPGNKYALV